MEGRSPGNNTYHVSDDGNATVTRGGRVGPAHGSYHRFPDHPQPGPSNLRYDEAGQGRPVVLIHGNFAGRSWWRELLDDPPRGVRLIAPDLPGFGESAAGPVFHPSMPFYADALSGFLDALGAEKPILVGHSFGAAVAVQLALQRPNRFPAMMLLGPPPLGGLETPGFAYPFLESYRHDRRALRRSLRRVMRTRTPPYIDDLVTEAQRMHPLNFSGNARIIAGWDVRGSVRRYTEPVLAVSGDRDALIPPSSAEATARAFPRGFYVNLGAVGHSPQIEAPERVRDLLVRLIETSNTPDPTRT